MTCDTRANGSKTVTSAVETNEDEIYWLWWAAALVVSLASLWGIWHLIEFVLHKISWL